MFREAGVFFIRVCDLEGSEHAIKDDSDFEEEVILDWSNIDDIFFH